MIFKSLKNILKKFLYLLLIISPIDSLLLLSNKVNSIFAKLLFTKDWVLEANGRPQFFKHKINLGLWPLAPTSWPFVYRGCHAREVMFRNCNVLDLCCGDGFYSYYFFSDIAKRINAVDNDLSAIKYAKKYHSNNKIIYHKKDIVNEDIPDGFGYDIVVWNAAICYFTLEEIKIVLLKIIKLGKPEFQLIGMLPKSNGYVDHKTEFSNIESVRVLLSEFFATLKIKEIDEVTSIGFYFCASSLRQ